jgi:hypothetical protein
MYCDRIISTIALVGLKCRNYGANSAWPARAAPDELVGFGRVREKQHHKDAADLQRLSGCDPPILACPDLRVIPGLDTFGLKLALQQRTQA